MLSRVDVAGCRAVSWPTPRFEGHLLIRVQGYERMDCLAATIKPARYLLGTHNYALSRQFFAEGGQLGAVLHHVDASRVFEDHPQRICRLTDFSLSMTLKHPCSTMMLQDLKLRPESEADGSRQMLIARVEAFAEACLSYTPPPSLAWMTDPLRHLGDLFTRVASSHR